MAVDSFSQPSSNALNDLDPLSRALLDLSVKRGMSDAEIAEILGTDSESVLENRVALLRSLAEQVAPESADAALPELEAVVADRVYGDSDPEPVAPLDDRPTQAHVIPSEPIASVASKRKRRSPLAVLLPVLILVALVGIVLVATGGSADDSGEPAAERPQTSTPDRAAEPQRARLSAVGGVDARGTATVDGNRLRLRVTGLPKDGSYQVWLYDSIIDARSLGRLSANGTLRVTLPANAGEFDYVDVSREPADGNANHSGQSVLRVATRELR